MGVKTTLQRNKSYIIEEYNKGTSTCELGRKLSCSNAAVYLFLRDVCKIPIRKVTSLEDYKDDIIKLHGEGKSLHAIGKELGLGSSTINRYCKKLELNTSRYSSQRKDQVKNHTKEIIADYESGMGCTRLAKKYKCTEPSIRSLLRKNGLDSNRYQITYNANYEFFDTIDTESKAYVYGFFVGDGHNATNGNIQIRICDRDILEDMKNAMEFTGPIHDVKHKGVRQPIYGIFIGSKYMSKRLTEIGCPHNKEFKTYYPSTDILPQQLDKHYIRGLLDSDGSVYSDHSYNNGNALLYTFAGTEKLLTGVKKVFDNLGIDSRLYPHGENCHILRVIRQADVKKLANWLYKDATIFLKRKRDRVAHLID